MTDCPRADIRELLPEWVNGSLDEPSAGDVAEHVATCAACSQEAELIRAMRGVLVREPAIDVQRVAHAVAARLAQPKRRPRRAPWLAVAGGLALAASLLLAAVLLRDARSPAATRDLAVPVADVGDPHDGRGALPDDTPGTRVAPATTDTQVSAGRSAPAVTRLADAGLTVNEGLSDLEEDQLATLLRRLESMDAVPPISPAPAVITDFDIQ